ncbi:MAG TPA: DUF2207 domain-containing protein [Acidimicrobiales bacterium]|nr:DUF2207 domain-containing protein [Acidimicrobiales bacterium]
MGWAQLRYVLGVLGALTAIVLFGGPATAEHMSAEILGQIPPEARSQLSPEMVEQISRAGHVGAGAPSEGAALDGGAFAAADQAGNERIHTYDVQLVIEKTGDLLVKEVINYDFGPLEKHGIFREIPVRLDYDDRYERVYKLTDIDVTATDASSETEETDEGRIKRLRIGDPDSTVSGRHTYTISYRVRGALNGFEDHDELFWNAIGEHWPVPVGAATVSVTAPAGVTQIACFAGPAGSSLPCQQNAHDGPTATFRQVPMGAYQAFTVVVAFPKGAVPEPKPILDEKWTPARAFAMTPATLGLTGGLGLIVLGGIAGLGWTHGRDRRYIGSAVDATFGNEGGQDEAVPLFSGDETPVEFAPPDNLRPGQVGTLVDETANPIDVTATIVDLAVRGWLRIEEIAKEGLFGKPDWKLVKLKEADDKLLAYETRLLNSLVPGEINSSTLLSDLKNTFATKMRAVQDDLYDDSVSRGWFRSRPDKVRASWVGGGVLVLLLGIGLTVLAALFTSFGLVFIPLAVGGILLIMNADRMPRRTAQGTGVLRRTLGFRRFIDESEKERAQFAERAHLFTEYLPYAIVFGATEKWARAFAGLDGELPNTGGWYVGHNPGYFHAAGFSSAMDNFSTTTAGTLTSTPSGSGSSGFGGGGSSGGGGGGGGGGSW